MPTLLAVSGRLAAALVVVKPCSPRTAWCPTGPSAARSPSKRGRTHSCRLCLPSVKRYPDYFGHYSISLGFGEQYTLQVTASASRQYCEFGLELTVIDNGATVTEKVDNQGQPFRLTPLPERSHRVVFSSYQVLYLTRFIARGGIGQGWVRGNPKTFTF